jgi:UDP-N-acetylglucosamine:LPS N-acetylglucosamine transferase
LPYAAASAGGDITLLVTDVDAGNAAAAGANRITCVSSRDLARRHLHYEDLVAAADVVVSKPGYGIVSECIANGTSMLYTSRGRFAEHELFVREMPAMLRCRYISPEDLREGRWSEAIASLLEQAPPPTGINTGGADVAAERILAEARA